MKRPPIVRTVAVVAVLLASAAAYAQYRGYGYGSRIPPRFPTANSFDGYFNFCRGMYYSDRREAGGQGWWTDYPAADVNFSIRLSELTKTRVSTDRRRPAEPSRRPAHRRRTVPVPVRRDGGRRHRAVQRRGSEAAARSTCSRAASSGSTISGARRRGGSGSRRSSASCRRRTFPSGRVPPDHPIFRTLFQVAKVPQIPSITGGAAAARPQSAAPRAPSRRCTPSAIATIGSWC